MGEKEGLAGLDILNAFIQTPSTAHEILHASTPAIIQYSWKVFLTSPQYHRQRKYFVLHISTLFVFDISY